MKAFGNGVGKNIEDMEHQLRIFMIEFLWTQIKCKRYFDTLWYLIQYFLQNKNIFLDNPTLYYLEKAQFLRSFFAPFPKAKFSTSLLKQWKKLHFHRLLNSDPKTDKPSIKKLHFIIGDSKKTNLPAQSLPSQGQKQQILRG